MSVAKILARGQVTLPSEVRRKANIRPGDRVAFRVLEPGKVELQVLPRLTLAEALERYHIEKPIDDEADRREWHETAAKEALAENVG